MSDTVMALSDAYVAYQGDISILRGLDIAVERNRITGIIGPNGAGKSTALKTLYGFLALQKGDVWLEGERVTGMRPSALAIKGIAYVPQNRSVFEGLSVEDNLRLGGWAFRKDKPRMARALERVYDRFPILKERRRAYASTLSGGQQRFLELARALMLEPKVMLLDEPTAMIAPRISQELYRLIESLPDQGITVVLVDQNVRSCVRVSHHVYILDLGRNSADGDAADFAGDTRLRSMIAEWLDYRID